MNESLTLTLNNLAGVSLWFDYLVIFCARFLPWVIVVTFFVDIIASHNRTVKPFLFSVVGLVFIVGITGILKALFVQARPFESLEGIAPLFLYSDIGSFPSGHAFFFASIFVLSLVWKSQFVSLYMVSAFLIGTARVIAGVHYVGDVVWGLVLGVLVTYIYVIFFKQGSWELT